MKSDANYKPKSALWQELEYLKRLKKLIESGLPIAEIEIRSQQIYEELKNERPTQSN